MSRPTKLDVRRREAILESLRTGSPRGVAARTAGIAEATFFRWMVDGRPLYREFREAVERAEAEAEHSAVQAVRGAMTRHWRAAAWWLERRSDLWRAPSSGASEDGRRQPSGYHDRVVIIDPRIVAAVGLESRAANQTGRVATLDAIESGRANLASGLLPHESAEYEFPSGSSPRRSPARADR